MKNKLLVIILALIMVLSCAATSYAATPGDEGIDPQSTSSVIFNIHRTSGTTASATVVVSFSSEADSYNVVVYLQKLVNGTWENDYNNQEYVFYNNGYNSSAMMFSHNYTHLVYGTSYRLMVISRDIHGDTKYYSTVHSNLF